MVASQHFLIKLPTVKIDVCAVMLRYLRMNREKRLPRFRGIKYYLVKEVDNFTVVPRC